MNPSIRSFRITWSSRSGASFDISNLNTREDGVIKAQLQREKYIPFDDVPQVFFRLLPGCPFCKESRCFRYFPDDHPVLIGIVLCPPQRFLNVPKQRKDPDFASF